MTRRYVILAVLMIVASVGCGSRTKEPTKPAATDTAATDRPSRDTSPIDLASLAPRPFVLPEDIAQCIANELVVTTYLRGGPEQLTVDTDVTLSKGISPFSRDFLEYGIGMPLKQWSYDGRTLSKKDAWRALVAQSACDSDAHNSIEHILTYCVWNHIGDKHPHALGDCVQRIKDRGLSGDDSYRHWSTRSHLAANAISEMNRDAINAVTAALRHPRDPRATSIMNDVGTAPVDDCGIRQWQFGWYRDLLRAHPLSYTRVRDAAPGKYPVAIDDGACPMPGPAHPRTFAHLDTLSAETRHAMDDVFGPPLTRFIHFNGSPRLTHFLNVQFDPNDFRVIPQIDAVVSRRLRDAHKMH